MWRKNLKSSNGIRKKYYEDFTLDLKQTIDLKKCKDDE